MLATASHFRLGGPTHGNRPSLPGHGEISRKKRSAAERTLEADEPAEKMRRGAGEEEDDDISACGSKVQGRWAEDTLSGAAGGECALPQQRRRKKRGKKKRFAHGEYGRSGLPPHSDIYTNHRLHISGPSSREPFFAYPPTPRPALARADARPAPDSRRMIPQRLWVVGREVFFLA